MGMYRARRRRRAALFRGKERAHRSGLRPVIENGTVVIAKGLIQAVGTNVTIPPEAWVIDGKGLTVYPGLD